MPNYTNPGLVNLSDILRTSTVPVGPAVTGLANLGNTVTAPSSTVSNPPKPNNPTQVVDEIRNAYGPDALMNATNTIFNQINQSPAMRAQLQQIMMGQNAAIGGVAGMQGRTGMSQTGVGQARSNMQRSSGAYQQAQAQGQAYQQAGTMAATNLGLQGGLLPQWHQAMNPEQYSPWTLQESRQEHDAYMAKINHMYGRDMAELLDKLSKDTGMSLGEIFTVIGGSLALL